MKAWLQNVTEDKYMKYSKLSMIVTEYAKELKESAGYNGA
jgi:hypothetical protein